MKIKKTIFSIISMMIVTSSITACVLPSTSTPSTDVQVTNITENELTKSQITQTKIFDQCDSASVFRAEVQFSDTSSQANQQDLVLGTGVTGSGNISVVAKLEIKGSIEAHFSEIQQQAQGHSESASIEVPAHTRQEYTIIWQEIRRDGLIEYVENGETKSTSYSYRVGLDLISASGKDILCLAEVNTPENPITTSTTLLENAYNQHSFKLIWAGGESNGQDDSKLLQSKITSVVIENQSSAKLFYDWHNGVLSGTMSGYTLSGTWTQDNGQGNFELTFTSDFSSAKGWWNSKNSPGKHDFYIQSP